MISLFSVTSAALASLRVGERQKKRVISRTGHGLHPRYLDVVLGKKVNRDVKKGTPVGWEMIG